MKFHIHAQDTLEALQKTFTHAFPFLKLEFFAKPHEKGRPTEKHFMINTKRTVDSCNPKLAETTVSVPTAMTVQELEALFRDRLGLYVQVFRKSGNVWLETTATDDWSLFKQNMEGKELSEASPIQPDELPDYHEQP
ncbi:MAG: hypothetical protein ACK478_07640 [Flavobacteriales bacterium]|jgi:hypothetical protein